MESIYINGMYVALSNIASFRTFVEDGTGILVLHEKEEGGSNFTIHTDANQTEALQKLFEASVILRLPNATK
jgi:hypothetical protein